MRQDMPAARGFMDGSSREPHLEVDIAPHQADVRCGKSRPNWRRGCGVLAVSLLAACSGGGDGSSTSTPPVSSGDYSALQAKLQSYVDDGTVSGLAFTLVNANGTLFTYAAGNMTADSRIPIASASKAPTVAAILTLVDQGLLNLDRPVSSYLAGNITWPADKAAITTRMLLNHTSGLPHLFAAGQPACLDDPRVTMQYCVQQIANAALEFAPGTAFAYGGSDYQVAAYVATLLSGQPWQTFFDQRITQPLGMTAFNFSVGGNGTPRNPNVAGSGNTSARDYSRFLQAILNGGKSTSGAQVLSNRFIAQYGTSQITGLPIVYTPTDSTHPGYSYGWFIAAPGLLQPGSAGPEITDEGLFGTTPWIDFDVGYGAALFIQGNISSGQATGAQIQNGVRPLILKLFGRG